MFKSYTFGQCNTGQNILILGAVHGNETAGSVAQKRIIDEIQQGSIRLKTGRVTFIPVVNELAQIHDKRFIDVDLNRVICACKNPQRHEEKIANELLPFLDTCDVLLDLHSTHCPADVPFAFIDYASPANLEMLSLIPVQTALAGWPEIYRQNTVIQNNCTEEYIHRRNKIGLTVECGYHKAESAIQIARQSILNVLSHYAVIDLTAPKLQRPHVITLDRFIVKKAVGQFEKPYQHLDVIKSGDILARYENGETLVAPFDGFMIMPNPSATLGHEWFYLGHD